MARRKHHQITVVGPIASGKTTASQLLSEKLSLPLIDADLYEKNPFLENYIKDTRRWSFATELFFTIQRIKKLRSLKTLLRKSSVIVDSGLIMSHQIYTKNHLVQGTMTAAEWEFFSTIIEDYHNHIPSPTRIIHLTASPKTQLKRIKKRGRAFESGYTIEYLEQITDRLDEYANSLDNHKQIKLLEINTQEYDLSTKKGENYLIQSVQKTLK